MAIKITMPRLSDTMEVGTLVKWYVKKGDAVSQDQVLADIETDKATMEMPAYDEGTVAAVLVEEGANVGIGETLLILAEPGEDVEAAAAGESAGAAGQAEAATAGGQAGRAGGGGSPSATGTQIQPEIRDANQGPDPSSGLKPQPSAQAQGKSPSQYGSGMTPGPVSGGGGFEANPAQMNGGRVLVSPLARRMAEEMRVDLRRIEGTGPGGRIVKRDILRAVNQPPSSAVATPAPTGPHHAAAPAPAGRAGQPAAPAPLPAAPLMSEGGNLGRTMPLSNMRQTIARRLVESKTQIPHYQVAAAIDMTPLMDLRKTLNAQLADQGVKLSVNDFIVRACAIAIHRHPLFNASFKGDSITVHDRVNIGVAISLPEERGGGLVVGTLFDADRKSLRHISADTRSLAEKARSRGLSIEEMSGSTFTISNLGMYDVEFFTAIINPPNSAILAVGSTVEKPVVREGEIVIGQEMICTLSNDHRIIDGASAAMFMQTFKHIMQNPATMLV